MTPETIVLLYFIGVTIFAFLWRIIDPYQDKDIIVFLSLIFPMTIFYKTVFLLADTVRCAFEYLHYRKNKHEK